MKSDILISVIIPCYNNENTILHCLESVLRQSYRPLEVLVINDGSTDSSATIINKFIQGVKQNIRIRLLNQNNSGPSAARNTGVKHSQGTWVAFLDADDFWELEKLEMQKYYIDKFDELALLGVNSYTSSGSGYKSIDFNRLLFRNYFRTSGVMVKRSILLSTPFDERMRYSEDYRLWLIIAYKYDIGLIDLNLCGAISNRPFYRASGLSANLFAMQRGEISNYRYLYKLKYINISVFIRCVTLSYIKFIRRIILSFTN